MYFSVTKGKTQPEGSPDLVSVHQANRRGTLSSKREVIFQSLKQKGKSIGFSTFGFIETVLGYFRKQELVGRLQSLNRRTTIAKLVPLLW